MASRVHLVTTTDKAPWGIAFYCPGCDEPHSIPTTGPQGWVFNGSVELPTTTPSILVYPHEYLDAHGVRRTSPRCHSYVTDGRIQFLPDCTHSKAGQTVDLPDWPRSTPTEPEATTMSEDAKLEAPVAEAEPAPAAMTEPPAGTPLTPEERAGNGLPPLDSGTDEAAVEWRAEQASEALDAGPTIDIVEDDSELGALATATGDRFTIGVDAAGITALSAIDGAKLQLQIDGVDVTPGSVVPEPLNLTEEERAALPALDHSAPGERRLVHELHVVPVQRRCRICSGVAQFDGDTPHAEQAARHGGAIDEATDAFYCCARCLQIGGL